MGPHGHSAVPSAGTSASSIEHRYIPVATLKSGNGVVTRLVTDTSSGQQVVMKTIDASSVHSATRMRFLHETQVLATLNGSGLAGLLDAGEVDGQLFLVQSYFPGHTLEQVLAGGALSVRDTVKLGVDIASALDIAHGAGVCHRDVKPANIVVDALGQLLDATLLDFGFARSQWLDESIRDDLVGTVRYLAPESAGLLATLPDERSDLYSLGVILFECLAGAPPFRAESVGELLRQHLNSPVPELRRSGIVVPRAVDEVVKRLLRKDPDQRYQSAGALVADLSALMAAIDAGDPDPWLVIGREDRRGALADPDFVGRNDEIEELGSFVETLTAGGSGLVLLEADSGGGKSRLLKEVSQQASQAGVTVLHGQGVAQAGQRPFTLLLGVASELVARLTTTDPAGRTPDRAELTRQLRDVGPTIVRALPSLADVLEVPDDTDLGPEQFGEPRSIAALRRLLGCIASQLGPTLLVLDDCQWSDTLTVRLLEDLFSDVSTTPGQLGAIAAFRSEEVPAGHRLREIPNARHLSLGPLTAEGMTMLAESMAGPLPRQISELVVRLADGNPFMGAAVLRGLVEASALCPTDDGWAVDERNLLGVQTARRSAAFLVKRLELLSSDALEMLSVGAVLGKQFDISTALTIAGNPADAATIIEEARRRRLLWVDTLTGHCSFFHDKIREALLDRLPDDQRRSLHSLAADHILDLLGEGLGKAGGPDVVFDLAYHLDAARRDAELLPQAIAAAELARTRYALDAAVTHYRMAERAVTPDDIDTRLQIAEGLGDVLTLQGTYAEAETQLTLAHSLVSSAAHAADLDGKLGGLAFKQTDNPRAQKHLEAALNGLGRRIPRNGFVWVLRLAWELLVQAGHSIAPWLVVGRRSPNDREVDFLAMRIYSRLAYLYWFQSGRVPCGWAHLRGMNLAERYPPSAELGQAYSEHAPVMTMIPWYARGVEYARRSLEIRTSLGDTWGQGQSYGFTAVVHYAASDFPAALNACNEAIRLLNQTGDQWEVNTATWHEALCYLRMGDLTRAAEISERLFVFARLIGDQTAAGIALSIQARATNGDIDPDPITEQLTLAIGDAQTTAELQLARALVHRSRGDLAAARIAIETARTVVTEAGLRQEYVAPVYPWLATISRELVEQVPGYHSGTRRLRMRECRRAVRRARRVARHYRNNEPHALREAGLYLALKGRSAKAMRYLRRSVAVADAQGARFEAALSRLALAQLECDRGEVGDSEADLLNAQIEVDTFRPRSGTRPEEPAAAAISLFDRFASLLHVGRAITAATTELALEDAIQDAAATLLRAQRCQLIPVSSPLGAQLATLSGSQLVGASRSLIVEALSVGGPVITTDIDQRSDSQDSLVLSGIESALAAPIYVSGQPVLCLYATHSELGHLFGEDEAQLAGFISSLAGAAYEHLSGSETRFRSLAQNSSDVITLVDTDGVVVYQSPAVGRVFGMPAHALVGTPVPNWVHPDDLSIFRGALTRAGEINDVRVECRLRHHDGSYRFAETVITDLLDEPTVQAIVLNTRDVTDRRRAEEMLRTQNTELEKAGRAKDMFLASMSHELRTPLNAIIGFTGTLLMRLPGPLNDQQQRQLRAVEESGRHLLAIINDILDLAKIESGAVEIALASVDVGRIVETVVESLQPLADASQLQLTGGGSDRPITVISDERALGQILINLVNNAIKFTDDGSIDVSVVQTSQGVSISVRDTGMGIAADDMQRIRRAFERAPGDTNPREGTGLGLYISDKLAELIGAKIEVESTVGKGTRFTLLLPT